MQNYLARLLLRLELTAVLAYSGFGTLFSPQNYAPWIPHGIFGTFPVESIAVRLFALLQIGLVLWITANRRLDIAAIIAAAFLVGTALLNINVMNIVFRNIGLAFGAVALYALEREIRKKEE